jgi:hypothetical protein
VTAWFQLVDLTTELPHTYLTFTLSSLTLNPGAGADLTLSYLYFKGIVSRKFAMLLLVPLES